MVAVNYAYVYEDRDRHGNVRVYFWRGAGTRKVRLREVPGTEAFDKAYRELMRQSDAGELAATSRPDAAPGKPQHGTLRWLFVAYMASTTFLELDPATQGPRRGILEAIGREPINPEAEQTFDQMPASRLTAKGVRVLRDRKRATPTAANQRLKVLNAVFAWAIEEGHLLANPAREVARLKTPGAGIHSWSVEDVRTYEQRHPVGSMARLALAIFLFTGTRRSDAVTLGRQHERDGWFKFRQFKGRNRNPIDIEIPILAELREVIDATPSKGDLTYLVTEYGRPFTRAGFGNKMRDWCNQAGLPQCSSHGLRKAGAAIAAERGATVHQLMAIFGWITLKEAERYTRAAERKRMAGQAMHLLGKG
jgi:integrase